LSAAALAVISVNEFSMLASATVIALGQSSRRGASAAFETQKKQPVCAVYTVAGQLQNPRRASACGKGSNDESQSISQENLRKVQGNSPQRSRCDYLREPQAQATPGIIPGEIGTDKEPC
jgi:hypothetical protein